MPHNFEALKGKLYVNNPDKWDAFIPIDPAEFYKLWTKDLPGAPFVSIDFTGGGQGDMRISSRHNNSELFYAEQYFDTPRGTMDIKEIRIEDPAMRCKGLGKIFLDNQFNVARRWGLKSLFLVAGRENGPFFWSRRGAYIGVSPVVSESCQPLTFFKRDIKYGLCRLEKSLSEEFEQKVRTSLVEDGLNTNCVIARLPGVFNGRSMAFELLSCVTAFRVSFHLDDARQMKQVHENMSDIKALRVNMAATFS